MSLTKIQMANQTRSAIVKANAGVYYRPRTVMDAICLLFRVLSSSDRVSLWGVGWISDDYLPKDISDMIVERFRLGPVPGFHACLLKKRFFTSSPYVQNNSYAVMWGGFPYEPCTHNSPTPVSLWVREQLTRDSCDDSTPHQLVALKTSTGIKIAEKSEDERFWYGWWRRTVFRRDARYYPHNEYPVQFVKPRCDAMKEIFAKWREE